MYSALVTVVQVTVIKRMALVITVAQDLRVNTVRGVSLGLIMPLIVGAVSLDTLD